MLFSSGDISPPRGVRAAMEMQAEAERKKRAQILESEGNHLMLKYFWGSSKIFNIIPFPKTYFRALCHVAIQYLLACVFISTDDL